MHKFETPKLNSWNLHLNRKNRYIDECNINFAKVHHEGKLSPSFKRTSIKETPLFFSYNLPNKMNMNSDDEKNVLYLFTKQIKSKTEKRN